MRCVFLVIKRDLSSLLVLRGVLLCLPTLRRGVVLLCLPILRDCLRRGILLDFLRRGILLDFLRRGVLIGITDLRDDLYYLLFYFLKDLFSKHLLLQNLTTLEFFL